MTRAGSEGEYRVVRVDCDSLYVQPTGRHNYMDPKQSIAYNDIRALPVTRPDKTAIGAGLGAAAVIVAGAVFAR